MGAKTWTLVGTNGAADQILKSKPSLDRAATLALAHKLFPSESLAPLEDGSLSFTCPPDKELLIGCFEGINIVAAKEFAIDRPSTLPLAFLQVSFGSNIYLVAMHSVVDWFAYAIWQDGQLVRSLSVSPDDGVIEDIGAKLPFEEPYWAGQHPVVVSRAAAGAYPLPFHPLELGDAALLAILGYQLEGLLDPSQLEPDDITLMCFKRLRSGANPSSRPWWKFW
jgi:hypothetical protein